MPITPEQTRFSPVVVGTLIGGLISNTLLTIGYSSQDEDPVGAAAIAVLGALWAAWFLILVVASRQRFSIKAVGFTSTVGGLCIAIAFTSYFLIS